MSHPLTSQTTLGSHARRLIRWHCFLATVLLLTARCISGLAPESGVAAQPSSATAMRRAPRRR